MTKEESKNEELSKACNSTQEGTHDVADLNISHLDIPPAGVLPMNSNAPSYGNITPAGEFPKTTLSEKNN